MKSIAPISLIVLISTAFSNAYVQVVAPNRAKSTMLNARKTLDFKNAAMATFAAATIASSVFTPMISEASDMNMIDSSPFASTSTFVSEKVIKAGLYKDYEIDAAEQQVDDARSTFKGKAETKSKKGKYTALLGVLVVGSFIIPMAQYFWYVRDDDSSDRFFQAQNIPEPEPEKPKKKGWF